MSNNAKRGAPKRAATKKNVYLAGPISNCNERQIHEWREEIRGRWGQQFEFIDPLRRANLHSTPWEIAHADLEGIRKADAVLANMWKESIGTAFGIAHAARHGRPVFVSDSNRLDSSTVAFYAHAVVRTPDEAMRRIREFFKAQDLLRTVVKRNGEEEEFDREKLLDAIRRACRAAQSDDLLPPTEVLPESIKRLLELKDGPGRGRITTTAIRDAVWDTLRVLEADALRGRHFAGIRDAWEQYDRERRRPRVPPASPDQIKVHPHPLDVRVASNKSHESVWGKAVKRINDVPGDARRLFREICRVEGIREIRLTKNSTSRFRRLGGVKGEIFAARALRIVEGKCYDVGVSGEVQMFQILVHDTAAKEAIRRRIIEHLRDQNLLLASPPVSLEDYEPES